MAQNIGIKWDHPKQKRASNALEVTFGLRPRAFLLHDFFANGLAKKIVILPLLFLLLGLAMKTVFLPQTFVFRHLFAMEFSMETVFLPQTFLLDDLFVKDLG